MHSKVGTAIAQHARHSTADSAQYSNMQYSTVGQWGLVEFFVILNSVFISNIFLFQNEI